MHKAKTERNHSAALALLISSFPADNFTEQKRFILYIVAAFKPSIVMMRAIHLLHSHSTRIHTHICAETDTNTHQIRSNKTRLKGTRKDNIKIAFPYAVGVEVGVVVVVGMAMRVCLSPSMEVF